MSWSTDGFHNPNVHPDVTHSTSAVNGFNNNYAFGYSDYKDICLANSASSTLMFNVTFDDATSLKNRLSSRQSDGLTTKWIELGNEIYFPGDQIGNVKSPAQYISVTNNITTQLKTIDPNIKVAVPLENDNYLAGDWNMTLANETYFDAYSAGPDIDTNLKGLYAKAVNTGTEHKIFVVNKLPVTSTLNYAIDGIAFDGNYTIETFTEDITAQLTTPYTSKASAWNSSSESATSGNLSIPAYSINVITIEDVLSISNFSNNFNTTVYPTLANDNIFIKSGIKVNRLQLINVLGTKVLSINNPSKTINISNNKRGMYFVVLELNNNHRVVKKIINIFNETKRKVSDFLNRTSFYNYNNLENVDHSYNQSKS